MSNPHEFDEQHSAAFDGECDQPQQEVESGTDSAAWQIIRNSLQAMPVPRVELSTSVVEHLSSDRANQQVITRQKTESESTLLRWIAVTTSCVAVVLVCYNLILNFPGPDPNGIGGAATVDAHVIPAQWEVVVVTIDDESRSAAMQLVRESANEQGMQLLSVGSSGSAKDTTSDVLLVSGDLSHRLTSMLDSRDAGLESELNPDLIDGMKRDELLSRFADSMNTPTRSDEYFGEMFVLVPDDDSLVVRTVPEGQPLESTMVASAKDSANRTGTTSSAGENRSEADAGQRPLAAYLQKGKSKPVLVVFRSDSSRQMRVPALPENFREFPHL